MMAEPVASLKDMEFLKNSINHCREPGDGAMVRLAPFFYDKLLFIISYFCYSPPRRPLRFRHTYALIASSLMPHVCVLITDLGGRMPKRSDLKLTKRTVDALEADGKDALFWDRELAGFGVRVHATGRKTFVVQSRGPSGPKRVTLGRHGELSCEEARKQAALVIDRIKRGEEPVAEPPEGGPTVAGLAERFMRTHVEKHLKPASVAAYRTTLDKHILPALGGTALTEVGGAEVTALHHGLRDTPVLANRAVHLLSRMFVLAEAWELVPPGRNPCIAVRRYRTRARERFLTPEEYRRLGRALGQAEAEGGAS